MSRKESRLLEPALLPGSLWNSADGALRFPPPLTLAYETVIDRHNLRELVGLRNRDDPPVGGLTQELADKHFAQAFDGSVARAQLALLDPKRDATHASNAYVQSLAGNRLSLTDAPCGAGAATFGFLASIAELRACDVLPRHPLDVFLIGAELSAPARAYALEILNEICPFLEAQAIFVEAEFLSWDVTDSLSNTDLIRRMTVASGQYPTRLMVVANFNAFLIRDEKRKKAQPQLGELFRYASGENSLVVWMEPDMNRATADGGLFSWLRGLVNGAWRLFAQERSDRDAPVPTSEARFYEPLNPEVTARVGLAVMPLDLVRSK